MIVWIRVFKGDYEPAGRMRDGHAVVAMGEVQFAKLLARLDPEFVRNPCCSETPRGEPYELYAVESSLLLSS